MTDSQFLSIASKLPEKIGRAISFLPENTKRDICEIRLYSEKPVMLTLNGKAVFLCRFGGVSENPYEAVRITKEELNECFLSLCNHSVYAHTGEIKEGYLAVGYGCRAGIAGRFFEGRAAEITSLNLRISHEIEGIADSVLPYSDKGLLIAGPPASGKTTLLRDVAKQLSNGNTGSCKRVSVIDTREEITTGFDMGYCTDTIIIGDKSKGIEIALRTLSPQIICFDEIGNETELKGVKNSLNAGVKVITTVHAETKDELIKRPITRELLQSGAIRYVALLSGDFNKKPIVYKREELVDEFS